VVTVSEEDPVEELRERRDAARRGGGDDRIARHHEKGKLTARERVEYHPR
jgi:acetyl-CoA/propionyl-CoA carboxylase carboxyl transferase subunit